MLRLHKIGVHIENKVPLKLTPAPVLEKIRTPEILHRPIRTETLENNAVRANVILAGVLKSLAKHEAILVSRVEEI